MSNAETESKKSPTHIAYVVRESKGKSYFTRVGVAWQHKAGGGLNIQLVAVPLDGRVTLFTASEKKD